LLLAFRAGGESAREEAGGRMEAKRRGPGRRAGHELEPPWQGGNVAPQPAREGERGRGGRTPPDLRAAASPAPSPRRRVPGSLMPRPRHAGSPPSQRAGGGLSMQELDLPRRKVVEASARGGRGPLARRGREHRPRAEETRRERECGRRPVGWGLI
jgi:hypothetical protein